MLLETRTQGGTQMDSETGGSTLARRHVGVGKIRHRLGIENRHVGQLLGGVGEGDQLWRILEHGERNLVAGHRTVGQLQVAAGLHIGEEQEDVLSGDFTCKRPASEEVAVRHVPRPGPCKLPLAVRACVTGRRLDALPGEMAAYLSTTLNLRRETTQTRWFGN